MNLKDNFQTIKDELVEISRELYNNPEIGHEEFASSKLLTEHLEKHGFQVETGLVNQPTSFRAEFESDKPGPTIAYMAEYDALPGIGHGCGHNLIAAMSTGAGILLKDAVNELGGKVVVLGTPAEETNGAKVPMAAEGVFNDIDIAMMVHPDGASEESGPTLALDALQFEFTGKTSHAAASPEDGINALDGVIQLFNGINALRGHLPSDVRMHGIIPQGGQAANVITDYAVAQFYFRAKTRETLNEVIKKIRHVADGAASMTGATVEISNYELSNDNLVPNQALSKQFTKNFETISGETVKPAGEAAGSSDMGNVSKVVPSIHPFVGMNDESLVAHTTRFADQTQTKDGLKALENGVVSLAQTGMDILSDPQLFKAIQDEFKQQ
ncbi:MAG TPA: M20 family metallopeptidase [Pseudogracilibacillus sp.]|nr:M20 family metallopeptidase [Pseudogracilibacillus sp.]